MRPGFERTLIILKPDAVARRLMGRIIARIEEKGLVVCAMKMISVDRPTAEAHYGEHAGKPFFEGLVRYITSGPVVALVAEGRSAVSACRSLAGGTDGAADDPGTIRGDFGVSQRYNLVHASDSVASAEREIGRFFTPDELLDRDAPDAAWINDLSGPEPI